MSRLTAAATLCSLSLLACGSTNDPPSSPDAGAPPSSGQFTLRVDNVLDWCDVTVDGTTFTATSPPALSFAAGTVVTLDARPTSNAFIWGYWTGTDKSSAASRDTSQAATVTMSANRDVKVCCPFTDGSGC